MELIINETADLLAVAAILVKNGYTVRQSRRRKTDKANGYDKVLVITKEVP